MHPVAATPEVDWRLGVVLVLLVAAAALASWVAELGVRWEQVTAAARAVVQLAVVSVVIAAVIASTTLSFAFVALMFGVATLTAVRRVGAAWDRAAWVALAIAAGAGPVIALCLGSGVVPLNGAGIIPIAGIVIGNAMTAATLTGRRAFDELAAQRPAYEGALALGLMPRDAAYLVIQPSARESLTPGLDQTRTVGLVTLPGAFVGVLLGGGTAIEAGAAQVLVLVGLLCAQATTSATMLQLVARRRVMRDRLVMPA